MKKLRIYVDTSVIGGCFDPEFKPWSDGLMKDFSMEYFIPVISEVVKAEILPAPEAVRKQYERLMELEPEVLLLNDEVQQLAARYKALKILNAKFYNDLVHIALATVASVDILTSWNFKHIVHYDKIRQFNEVNMEQGYNPIQIYSPREVTHYEND
jgi:hypothetical protein